MVDTLGNPNSRPRALSLNSVVAQRNASFGVANNKQTIQELADQSVANKFTSPLSSNSQIDPNQSIQNDFMEAYFENARNQIKLQTSFAFIQAGAQLAKEGLGWLTSLPSKSSNKGKDKETKESDKEAKEKEAKETLAKNDTKEAEKNKETKEVKE